MPETMTSAEVREKLLQALGLDLVGPNDDESNYVEERLDQAPSQWYLTGFLVPGERRASRDLIDSDLQQQSLNLLNGLEDEEDDEDDDELDDVTDKRPARTDDTDKEAPRGNGKPKFLPSSIGLTVLIPGNCHQLKAIARWGDYKPVLDEELEAEDQADHLNADSPDYDPAIGEEHQATLAGMENVSAKDRRQPRVVWQRFPRQSELTIELTGGHDHLTEVDLPESNDMKLAWIYRQTPDGALDPTLAVHGATTVSVYLINNRQAIGGPGKDQAYAFQAELQLECIEGFVPRPGMSGLKSSEEDLRIADVQYRDVFDYAVGHNVSATTFATGTQCHLVRTAWIPTAAVELVQPALIAGVEMKMEALADLSDHASAIAVLMPLAAEYKQWILQQKTTTFPFPERDEIAATLLERASEVARRIEEGVNLLSDEKVFTAFRIANQAMAMQARRRMAQASEIRPEDAQKPEWRPFQLAFLLMNLKGVVDPSSADREIVELLFFPTGGGKTEAYLGLAAFTLVFRRLREGVSKVVPKYAGVAVLMRYTLRLLTLDQMGRASAMICALELIRRADVTRLGKWPFEIGLWVGAAATPNYMGHRRDENSMVHRVTAYKNATDNRRPIPMEKCPWCGRKFEKDSFVLHPGIEDATNLHIHCLNENCDFSGDQHLPILMVDEPIYRRLPCFLIATVDKFASMPWRGEIAGLFGKVSGYVRDEGFVGLDGDSWAQAIDMQENLPPPELIIQDELHLISGPLGTIAGLFETAIEALSCRNGVVPKIVSSTATVRRAKSQIGALFGRSAVTIFPPPGPDRKDSFFAKTLEGRDTARLYVGVAAQGRSVKRVVLRTYLALMSAAYKIYKESGGSKNMRNPADPYMTLLGYFNSLRELGGTRRLVEDELTSRLRQYDSRKRVGDGTSPFVSREIKYDVQELTSRISTAEVSAAKDALAMPHMDNSQSVDVSLATNMISVGLDITRLGLMAVYAQPKLTSEYIQATSRVGRDKSRPGLVVTIFNINRARDRSHYERFRFYHDTFYTGVEATSVTPFSPRALDRALFPVVVALARLQFDFMNAEKDAIAIIEHRERLNGIIDTIENRVRKVASLNPGSMSEVDIERVKIAARSLLDQWQAFAIELQRDKFKLNYTKSDSAIQKNLIYDVLDPKLEFLSKAEYRKFIAGRSMRDVEHAVALLPKYFDNNKQLVRITETNSTVTFIRQSQLVTSYGPGAMIELPWFSTVVSGLDFWEKGDRISEPRLMQKIQQIGHKVNALFTPKPYVEPKKNMLPQGVVVWRFPGWSLTQKTKQGIDQATGKPYQSRMLVPPHRIDRSNGKAELPEWESNRPNQIFDLLPIRFIRACEAGHMDDIDWKTFVHGTESTCDSRLWLDEMGTSGELTELRVRCGYCGKSRLVSESAGKNNPTLGKCSGRQDWLGQVSCRAECDKNMRLLIRTASNAYFPIKLSVISLPDREEPLKKAVGECLHLIEGLPPIDELPFVIKYGPELSAKLSKFDINDVWAEINARRNPQATQLQPAENIRTPELKLLISPEKYLGEDSLDSPFFAEAVELPAGTASTAINLVERVVMIHRLREVTALTGYSRFEYLSQDVDDDIPFAAETAHLGMTTDWLPAVENRGEGIFIQLKKSVVDDWAKQQAVQEMVQTFIKGVDLFNLEHQSNRVFKGPEYVLLHTLSHLLMHTIAMECGYPAASIKERIYNDSDVGYGIMLYTASSDSHGTLGGLVSTASSIDLYLQKALELGNRCSNDPICSLHKPDDEHDKRHFHGAACHGCVYVSETSCECMNDFLDRSLVVKTIAGGNRHFFVKQ